MYLKRFALLLVLIPLLLSSTIVIAGTGTGSEGKSIVVLGSSMARGWVTSYQAKYDSENGWVPRLGRLLKEEGYSLTNISIPGIHTTIAAQVFEEEVLPLKPDYVIIALSLGNEGVTRKDPEEVYSQFASGIDVLLDKCRANGIVPILASCYGSNDYSDVHYAVTKKMNLHQQSLGVPLINLLGSLDDGRGHMPEQYMWDESHPGNRGHEEMFFTVVPSLFDAVAAGKTIPGLELGEGFTKMGGDLYLDFIPDGIIHPFTFSFSIRATHAGPAAHITSSGGEALLSTAADGSLVYMSTQAEVIRCDGTLTNGAWHHIAVVHRYLNGETLLFVDGKLVGTTKEQVEPVDFVIGRDAAFDIRNVLIHRSALTPDEIACLAGGRLIHGSLDVYAPLADERLEPGKAVVNKACSLSELVCNPADTTARLDTLRAKIEKANEARANEFVVVEPEPVAVAPVVLQKLAGKYYITPDDAFVIEFENGKLYFVDRGERAVLLARSESEFYFRYPVENSITFFTEGEDNFLRFKIGRTDLKAKKGTE